ncbi:MAG: SprB repeat-containing protein [Flavobacteriales bacterium]|nr:SprB repeat-containing protein [Flavobacteriales bacterium]
MNRTYALLPKLLTILLSAWAFTAGAQTRYWVGGDGRWGDASHWSTTPDGVGGASIPNTGNDVSIATLAALHIDMEGSAECRSLTVNAGPASIRFDGRARAGLSVSGDLSATGDVVWEGGMPLRLAVRRQGVTVDLRGARIAGDLVLDGSGSWSVVSDVRVDGTIRLLQGTLIANAARIAARRVIGEAPSRGSIMAGRSVWSLQEAPTGDVLRQLLAPSAVLEVNGVVQHPSDALVGGDRDINVCGTDPGQTPFTVNAQVVTNYNGFGVRCRGQCNATVTVTVTGGSGNFSYSWLNGGPTTATWTTACGGPQLVVVTDVGQGISCPVQVNVTEPAPIGVIFFGQGTPPTCADVCNGTRTALAIGGVSPSTYNWNNGAGSSSTFSQLCAGLNTLQIRDANQCTFDTTFFFNVQPIIPNLTFTDAGCFGECDGTASVAPTGGTGGLTITWTPPPANQGALSINGLCAGNYSVRIADANGCDTTVAFVIAQPPAIDLNIQSTPASCASACDGSAIVTPSGTVGPYTYDWSPSPGSGQGTGNAGGLCTGIYSVLITDVPSGCDTLVSITIAAPPPFDVQGDVTDASCANTCDGGIVLTVSGGTPGYMYQWAPAPPSGQGTSSISGLCPGDWLVTITDVAGCDTAITFTVNAPPPLLAVVDATDASCAGSCDGEATVSVSGGTPNYTFVWTPAPAGGQGTATATGLCAGPYSLLVTDENGCDTTLTFLINEPPPITATSSHTNVTCGSLCDGTASVVASGGNGGFTYVWTPEPATGQGTPDATGFCAGPVSVLITDVSGCTHTVDFLIEEAVPLLLSLQVLPASCPGVCDGEAGVIVSGGTPDYTYAWSPEPGAGQGTSAATQLCPQAYNLTVTDAVGCDSTIAFTITAPPPIEPNAVQTEVTCAGDCDGRITLAPTGGNGTFTYNWVPAPTAGQGTAEASMLCAGDWAVTITSGACDTTVTFTITEPLPITAAITTTDTSCPGTCDGTATVTASGGTGTLTYTWGPDPVTGQGTTEATDLCPGPHTLTIADAAGCDTTITFTILEPIPMTALQNKTNVTCGNLCDGAASVTVSGGAPDYSYLWTPEPATGQGTESATGFCAGPVTVLITDANGCSITVPFNIEPAAPILLSLQLTPTSCPNTCDGEAGVIPSGGISPYSYAWAPEPGSGQGTDEVSGLCAQAYTLTVTDDVGCDTTIAFTITSPEPIVPNAMRTDVTCAGDCDGTITLAPTGGDGNYAFNWTPPPPVGQGTGSVSGLCAGDWSVTIASGSCDTTITITIVEPSPILVDLVTTDASCTGECDGTATASASGGSGILGYVWSPVPSTGQGTPTAGGLCAGPYTLTVTDAAGCDTTIAFVITDPAPITASVITTAETCAGPCTGTATVTATGGTGTIVFDWQPPPGGGQGTATATGLCAGTAYTVTLSDANGCGTTLNVTIDPSAVILPNSSSTPVTCNGSCDGTATVGPTGGVEPYTYTWSPPPPIGQGTPTASGLCAGPVQVTIVDNAGCSVVAEILITEPPPIITDVAVSHPLCVGVCNGSITLTTSGGGSGYTYVWSPQPPAGQGTATISGLCGGTWNVLITDNAGCTQQASYTTIEPTPITLDVVATPSQCQVCIGAATATFSGGTGVLSVQWTNAQGAVIGNADAVTDLCAGLYTVTVQDENGCSVHRLVSISDTDGEELTVTDGTTSCPNTCDGGVSVSFNCSDPACSITWSDFDGNAIASDVNAINGLCPGDYYVAVSNASGCVTIDTATVVAPVVLTVNTSSSPVSCAGQCDGSATIGIVSGTPAYTFTWAPPPTAGQGTPHATGLAPGATGDRRDGNG